MDHLNLTMNSKAVLNNEVEMPILGLGTYNMKGSIADNIIQWAYDEGYRHFDTATYYHNEEDLGRAFKNYPRNELFVTTKIWPNEFGYDKTLKAFVGNLERLQFDYVDQLLIHWPGDKQKTLETWEAFIKIYDDEKARSIGVSNFSIKELELLKEAGNIKPVVNQIKFTPSHVNKKLVEYCSKENIKIVAYSPLNVGRGLSNKKLTILTKKYNKTVAQLILRWNIQQGVITIPKTSKKERLKENADIFNFSLSEEDLDLISKSDF